MCTYQISMSGALAFITVYIHCHLTCLHVRCYLHSVPSFVSNLVSLYLSSSVQVLGNRSSIQQTELPKRDRGYIRGYLVIQRIGCANREEGRRGDRASGGGSSRRRVGPRLCTKRGKRGVEGAADGGGERRSATTTRAAAPTATATGAAPPIFTIVARKNKAAWGSVGVAASVGGTETAGAHEVGGAGVAAVLSERRGRCVGGASYLHTCACVFYYGRNARFVGNFPFYRLTQMRTVMVSHLSLTLFTIYPHPSLSLHLFHQAIFGAIGTTRSPQRNPYDEEQEAP
jgi:hypothetical protein